jgi:hypothetical protein
MTKRYKRGWGDSMAQAGSGNYRGSTDRATRAGGYRTGRKKVTKNPVRKITSVSELSRIIEEYEKKVKGKIAKTPGAAAAYRAGLKIGSGGGSGKY